MQRSQSIDAMMESGAWLTAEHSAQVPRRRPQRSPAAHRRIIHRDHSALLARMLCWKLRRLAPLAAMANLEHFLRISPMNAGRYGMFWTTTWVMSLVSKWSMIMMLARIG